MLWRAAARELRGSNGARSERVGITVAANLAAGRLIFQAAAEFSLQASAATGSGEMTDHCRAARRTLGYRMFWAATGPDGCPLVCLSNGLGGCG
jgi:hypothetical protein